MVMVAKQAVNEKGHLLIGGIDSVELAKTYGTPLFVYDLSLIRERARAFINTFKELNVQAQVAYASKAFSKRCNVSSDETRKFIVRCSICWRIIYCY